MFKQGRTSLEDESRSGCPLVNTNEEICNIVPESVYCDRCIDL